MRRIIPHRPTTIVRAAVDGGRASIAAAGDGGFLPTDPKPNVTTPRTKPPTDNFGVFVGQSAWARTQLKNEERARKILLREYGGRAEDDESDEEEKVAKTNTRKFSEEELDAFLTNLAIECEKDHEKYEIVHKVFHKVIEKMTQDDELGDATQNDRVDKLAETAEEQLDAFVTKSFTTKLMIECDPKYEKRFREIIEKVRKKMIKDDGILEAFELVTNWSRCEPEYEKLLCKVLEKVREKITHQDDKGENENIHKIDMKVAKICSFEEKLDEFVMEKFLTNSRHVEEMKPYFMAYEVIEKVAKKVGNENLRKIAEKKQDALVTNSFLTVTMGVQTHIPYFKLLTWRLGRKWEDQDAFDVGIEVRGQLEGRKSELS